MGNFFPPLHVLFCMSLCVLILAAITKYHWLAGLNSRHLFLIVLETGKSKIEVLADSV